MSLEGKHIMQLGAGNLLVSSIKNLQSFGAIIHAADGNPDAAGKSVADHFVCLDIKSAEEVEKYARENPIQAIIPVNEAGVSAAAIASQNLGLKNITPETALLATDKGMMRTCWAEAGLDQPDFIVSTSAEDLKKSVSELGFPVIMKPCVGWGSKGIVKLSNDSEIDECVKYVMDHASSERYICEKLIGGTEMTVEGMVKNGEANVLALSDKEHQEHGRFAVAMGLNYPGNFSDEIWEKSTILVKDAIKAIGHTDGAFHAECMVRGDEVFLIELGARPGGGHIFSRIVEAASGVNMAKVLAETFLELDPVIEATQDRGVCYRFFAPPKGVFKGVEGIEAAGQDPHILEIGFDLPVDADFNHIEGDASRPGYIVSTGDTREAAMAAADKAIASLTFTVE